jgi:hypothetical protein
MMKDEVRQIILDFEDERISYEEAAERIKHLTGRSVDREELMEYWSGISLDDFVSILTEPDIENWQHLDDDTTLTLIREVLEGTYPSEGRLHRILEALKKRYSKPEVSDLIFHRDLSDQEILRELKKDTTIYL